MAQINLNPRTVIGLLYPVPSTGLVTVSGLADQPVNTLALDAEAKAEYDRGGKAYPKLGGYLNQRDHMLMLRLPLITAWFLVIENPSRESPVQVNYRVFGTDP